MGIGDMDDRLYRLGYILLAGFLWAGCSGNNAPGSAATGAAGGDTGGQGTAGGSGGRGGSATGGSAGSGTGGPDTDALDPWAQARRLGRGVNMGNMLEAPTEGEWGVTVQKQYFQLIADAGFNAVRVPIRWNAHADTAPPFAIDPAFLARVDEVLGWAVEAGLAVVINIHHYQELWQNVAAERARFIALWDQLSDHYADQPSQVMFEVVNEPTNNVEPEEVNSLLAAAVAVIRESNPNRTVVLGGPSYHAPWRMETLEVPPDETNIIGTFHMYTPFDFTHSGATWTDPMPPAGATWNGTAAERAEVDDEFALALGWSQGTGLPLYMGEFGAYEQADYDSRIRWTSYVAAQAVSSGIAFAYWEFCSGFGVYDPDAELWRQELLDALLQ
jgi:endoglucanase